MGASAETALRFYREACADAPEQIAFHAPCPGQRGGDAFAQQRHAAGTAGEKHRIHWPSLRRLVSIG